MKWNVNRVRDNIEFSYDGSTVSWISGDDERWWLSASGWWEETHSITSYYSSGNTKVTVSTTYYTGNKISGNANGSINGDVTMSASGGCSSMLHYYSELSH